MAVPLPAFRVLETFQVSPPLGSVAAEASHPLTFLEIIWLHSPPVERVFFYRLPHPTSHFLESVLPNLKTSLSRTLQHFYPLAGKLRRCPDSDEKFEIRYVDGDSVSFTVAEYDGDFVDLSSSHAREMARIMPLIPRLSRSEAGNSLLALQVTLFPNHGVAVGVSVHHSACDGVSTMSFLTSWASACRSEGTVPAPLLDKTVMLDPHGLYSIYIKVLLSVGDPLPRTSHADNILSNDVLISTFILDQNRIKKLKELIMAKSEEARKSFHCSTIVITYAYVWVCLVKARKFASDRTAHMVFAADCRGRLTPPLSAAYFGSCIGPCFVDAKAGDLTGEDGFMVACEAVGEAIKTLNKGALDGAEIWLERSMAIGGEQPLSVAGSPKFRVYDTDFGWGRPQKVEVPSVMRTGAISLAESRAEEGGVEIGLILPKDEIMEFGAYFSDGLKHLLG